MLAIRCTLLRDVFEGASPDDPRTAEWPPSWMRLFSALVSVADPGSDDDHVLRRLEAAYPPDILASEVATTRRMAFVPTNKLTDTRHGTLVARTNGERVWARCAPNWPIIWYRWSDLRLDAAETATLTGLCRRVPYLGRSTSPVLVEPLGSAPDDAWLTPHRDVTAGQRFEFETPVRAPRPGSLDELRGIYDEGLEGGRGTRDPRQVGVRVDYGRVTESKSKAEAAGPYPTLVVFELEGRRLDGRHTARVTNAIRRAVLSRASEHLATLHGHHDGDVVQCAFLGLLHVGHEYADGHLLGVGIAIPDLPAEQMAVVLGALPGVGGRMEVTAGPLGRLSLRRVSPVEGQRLAWGLRRERWIEAATTWATATPIVLDRFLKRGDDVAEEIASAAVNSRLPEPVQVTVSRRPVIIGSPDFSPRDTIRRYQDRRVKPLRYAAIEFEVPVRGPVVIGSMRHYGLGLCLPVRGDSHG